MQARLASRCFGSALLPLALCLSVHASPAIADEKAISVTADTESVIVYDVQAVALMPGETIGAADWLDSSTPGFGEFTGRPPASFVLSTGPTGPVFSETSSTANNRHSSPRANQSSASGATWIEGLTPIPEPHVVYMLAAGLILIGFRMRSNPDERFSAQFPTLEEEPGSHADQEHGAGANGFAQ